MKQPLNRVTVAHLVSHSHVFILVLACDNRASESRVGLVVAWLADSRDCRPRRWVRMRYRPQRGPLMKFVSRGDDIRAKIPRVRSRRR